MSGEIRFPIVGNLTADPELRHTQNGIPVVNFTIASTPRMPDGSDGTPVFMRCTAWRELAEHIAGSLKKGTRVVALGVYQQRRYEDEMNQRRTSHEFEVEAIGPDLRWATAIVTRAASKVTARPAPEPDAWAPSEPASQWNDETPF